MRSVQQPDPPPMTPVAASPDNPAHHGVALAKHVADSHALVIETHTSFTTLLAIRDEWDEFMLAIGAEVFLTFDWCRIWWDFYGARRQLHIFVVRDGTRIRAILPLFRERFMLGPIRITAVKQLITDFTPVAVIVPLESAFTRPVMTLVLSELDRLGKWDILHLGPISGKFTDPNELAGACRAVCGSEMATNLKKGGLQTYFQIAESWEAQLASLDKKQRAELRRRYDRLIQSGTNVEYVSCDSDSLDSMFDAFVNLHQRHWQTLGKPGHFQAWPKSRDFHHAVAESAQRLGRLRFYEILVNGKCLGYRYAYRFGDTYYMVLYARQSRDTNVKIDFSRLDFGEMVKRAIQERVRCFDSMQAEYDHKAQIGGRTIHVSHLYIRKSRGSAAYRAILFRWLATAVHVAYAKLWRARILPRLGIHGRQFSIQWMKLRMFSHMS